MPQKIKNDCEAAELNNHLDSTTISEKMQAPKAIPTWKLAVLFKHADRIINQPINIPGWVVNYDDLEFVLTMMLDAVRMARNGLKGEE